MFSKIKQLIWSEKKVETKPEEYAGEHIYLGTPFVLKAYKVDNGKGYWNSIRLEIFKDGNLIGGYLRNYSSFEFKTFCPFQIGETWYALYSKDYTATRIARLNDTFEDWCGEDENSFGFCPVEFFIPPCHSGKNSYSLRDGTKSEYEYHHYLDAEYENVEEFWKEVQDAKDPLKIVAPGKITWASWGLMCGCIWGDDSSWKVRYIDLSGIPNKILKIEERFGYWELPDNLDLREAIHIYSDTYFKLSGSFRMDLKDKPPNENFKDGFFYEDEDLEETEGEVA